MEITMELAFEELLNSIGREHLLRKFETRSRLFVHNRHIVGIDNKRFELGERDNGSHITQLLFVEVIPDIIRSKEELGIGMFDNMLHIVRTEILQNRDYNSSIGYCGNISHRPMGTVAPDKRHAVVFLKTALFEHQVNLLHLLCHLCIGEGVLGFVISKRLRVPILTERVLKETHEILVNHSCFI